MSRSSHRDVLATLANSERSRRSLAADVTYSKETHTYYTTLKPKAAGADAAAAADNNSSDVIKVPVLCEPPPGDLSIRPATHLLCQYLAYSIIASPPSEAVKRFSVMAIGPSAKNALPGRNLSSGSMSGSSKFPPLGKRVLELGCGPGLCGIVAALALSRKEREANAELCKAAAVLDFDKIDLDDLSSDSESEDSVGAVGAVSGGAFDDDSLGGTGGTGSRRPKEDKGDAIVVCTDGDPEAVELCRENVTRDLFLVDEHGDSLLPDEDEDDDDSVDEETKAALLAAAAATGGNVNPAGQRQPSDHRIVAPLDVGRKVAFEESDLDSDTTDSEEEDEEAAFGGAEGDVRVLARTLEWGDHRAGRDILKMATAATSNLFSNTDLDSDFRTSMVVTPARPRDERFDTVMAADVVLPGTKDEALGRLFRSVDQCLVDGGTFLLAFAPSADGRPETALRLLAAASESGFKVDCIPEEEFVPKAAQDNGEKSNPLLDTNGAKLLVLMRDEDAADFNSLLGSDSCRIFPGLKSQAENAAT